MSHFALAVFTEDKDQDPSELMEPFNENLEVETYISRTRDDLIQEGRKRMLNVFKNQYVEWKNDPAS